MSTPKKKRDPHTPLREDRNTDPRWTNWEYLAAFGEDDLGYTYLDAIKQFFSLPSDEEVWLNELARQARHAHDMACLRNSGRQAAWSVFRRAGMLLLHDEMNKRVKGHRRPWAVFAWPGTRMVVTVGAGWRVTIQTLPTR